MKVSSQLHAPASLPTEKEPLDGTQSQSGRCGVKKLSFPYRESNPGRSKRSCTEPSGIYKSILMNDDVRELYETLSRQFSRG
jgi:hypothetical protein